MAMSRHCAADYVLVMKKVKQVMAQPSMHCSVQNLTVDFELGDFGEIIIS